MGDYLNIERFAWFDHQVRIGRFPSASALARHFEISSKTAGRAIDFMRDRLGAPLEYDRTRKGWYYTEPSYTLPYIQASQEEILSILIARQLLSASAGGFISREIDKFSRRLFAATADMGLTQERLESAFAARWPGYSPASDKVFRAVCQALLRRRLLAFSYTAPSNGRHTERTAEPHHLQHYLGSWVLTAWCRLRSDWRLLYLSRMENVRILDEIFTPQPDSEWRHLTDQTYGIFPGAETTSVHLRFSAFRARWVREQVWHPDQQLTENPDGTLDLVLPVSDFREIKMKILSFGADVRVMAPEALKAEISEEIRKMAKRQEED